MNERDLTALLERATGDLVPEVDRLVADGTARGRTRLRRRRVGSALAVAAAVVVLTIGTSLLMSGDGGKPRTEPDFADDTQSVETKTVELPRPQPKEPDRPTTVSAREAPTIIGTFLPPGPISEPLENADFPLVDTADERLVHFRYDGTLTTFSIARADSLATCREFANAEQANESLPQPVCSVADGLEVLTSTQDSPVRTIGVTVWNHGYAISLQSYNVARSKNPDGSEDVPPVMDAPAISVDDLITIASSEVWFKE